MSWAERKIAENSTLGTADFLPLDKVIKGSFLDMWRFVGGSSVTGEIFKQTDLQDTTIKPVLGGSIYVSDNLSVHDTEAFVNGVKVGTIPMTISFKRGDVITITPKQTPSGSKLTISANVVLNIATEVGS